MTNRNFRPTEVVVGRRGRRGRLPRTRGLTRSLTPGSFSGGRGEKWNGLLLRLTKVLEMGNIGVWQELYRPKPLGYAQALRQIETGKIDPAYLLLGDNYYQRFLLTEKVVKLKMPAGERAYNRYSLSGNKANPSALEERLFGVPLLGGNTVVIVTELERLPQPSQQFLPKALKSLDASVTFIGVAKKLDGRTAFAKALHECCTVVDIKDLYDEALPEYVRSRFGARGFAIDADAVTEFCRIVGKDCGDIENEVEKLSIVHAGKKKVALDDIREYLSDSHFFSQFETAKQLGLRKLENSLAAIKSYLESSGSGAQVPLFWAIYSQFERMLKYRKLSGKIADRDLAGMMGMNPYFLKDLQQQAERYAPEELVKALLAVYQAETDDRFSAEAKAQIFERMTYRIVGATGE